MHGFARDSSTRDLISVNRVAVVVDQ